MEISFKKFEDIDTRLLYQVLQLRSEVFVVEQQCAYQDMDNKDLQATHLCIVENEHLLAYCRLLPKGLSYSESAIGRVAVRKTARNKGLARILMNAALHYILQQWNENTVRISAQAYLKQFYLSLGFKPTGKEYDEDGIPHIEMLFRNEKDTTAPAAS